MTLDGTHAVNVTLQAALRGSVRGKTAFRPRFEDLDRQEQVRITRYRELLDKDVERILGEIVERDRAEKAKQKNDSGKETK